MKKIIEFIKKHKKVVKWVIGLLLGFVAVGGTVYYLNININLGKNIQNINNTRGNSGYNNGQVGDSKINDPGAFYMYNNGQVGNNYINERASYVWANKETWRNTRYRDEKNNQETYKLNFRPTIGILPQELCVLVATDVVIKNILVVDSGAYMHIDARGRKDGHVGYTCFQSSMFTGVQIVLDTEPGYLEATSTPYIPK